MILEAMVRCPACGTTNALPCIAPFRWWFLLCGFRCYSCRKRVPVPEESR